MNNLFFELLQVALGTREKLSRVPISREWEEIYEEAERQAIVGLLLSGLESLPLEQLPPLELKLQWIGEVQMMEAEYRTHCERAKELTSRFRSVGFKSCVLKGVGMAQCYPVPERRQCGDIDIWVGPNVGKSEKGKVRSGAFRKSLMAYLRSQYKIGLVTWHHVDAEIFEDVPVEVHVHPGWMYHPLHNWRLQRWFKAHTEDIFGHTDSTDNTDNSSLNTNRTNETNGFTTPSVEFDAVYSLVHTFHHLMDEGVGLRHIVDYYYVLRKCHTDNTDILRVLKSIGLGKFAGAMMWVLKEACGAADEMLLCEPDEKEGRFLLQEIMLAGNFGQYDARMVIPENESCFHWIKRKFVRQLRFFKYYPGEVLWTVPWKGWHKGWRMVNG